MVFIELKSVHPTQNYQKSRFLSVGYRFRYFVRCKKNTNRIKLFKVFASESDGGTDRFSAVPKGPGRILT